MRNLELNPVQETVTSHPTHLTRSSKHYTCWPAGVPRVVLSSMLVWLSQRPHVSQDESPVIIVLLAPSPRHVIVAWCRLPSTRLRTCEIARGGGRGWIGSHIKRCGAGEWHEFKKWVFAHHRICVVGFVYCFVCFFFVRKEVGKFGTICYGPFKKKQSIQRFFFKTILHGRPYSVHMILARKGRDVSPGLNIP